MRSDRDDSLIEAAKHCDECLCWLEHCEAECCHLFQFHLTPRSDVVYSDDVVRIHTPLTSDAVRYYRLHGATVDTEAEVVSVPRAACRIYPDMLVITMRCSALQDDGLCALHLEGKPQSCQDFNLESASGTDFGVTPRCLYSYKIRGRGKQPADDGG